MSEQNHHIYEFGPFRLDAQKRRLLRGGETVKLFPKDFDTLLALVEHSGEVLDKEVLVRRLWGDTIVEDGNLATYISHLRKALGERPGEHEYIMTVPGKGYRFVAGVRGSCDELTVHERTRAEITVEETVATPGEAGVGSRTNSRGSRAMDRDASPAVREWRPRSRTLLALSVIVIIVVASFMFYKFRYLHLNNDRVAALPFRDLEITRLTNTGRATKAIISPDGKYFVHVTEDEEGQSLWVRQVAVATASQQIVPPRKVEYWGLTFSPDGNYIYCVVFEDNSGEAPLYRIPVLGGAATKLPLTPDSPISFSPDGKRMTFYTMHSSGSQLMIANADGTGALEIARRQQPEYFCAIDRGPSWSPDGKTITATLNTYDEAGQRETVLAVNLEDGTERIITKQRWWGVENVLWLRDGGGMLATVQEHASSPAQLWHISYPGGEARRITNDLNQYNGVSLTADTRAFVTVQTSTVSGVWVASLEEEATVSGPGFLIDESRARHVASEVGNISGVTWTPDGHVAYLSRASGTANLWMMRRDGSLPRQLTTDAQAHEGVSVSPDGRYVVFASHRSGVYRIWRADADGGNLKPLTDGKGDTFPHFSPDSQWVVFQRGSGLVTSTLWKVPVDGGEAVQLTDTRAQKPRVSPDGKLIAYYYLDPEAAESDWRMGVVSIEGGRPVRTFDFPPMVSARLVRWTPDGQALAYLDTRKGVSNIWLQPLDGGQSKQLTDFKAEHIVNFDWSHDGRSLAVVRADRVSDVVLIESRDR